MTRMRIVASVAVFAAVALCAGCDRSQQASAPGQAFSAQAVAPASAEFAAIAAPSSSRVGEVTSACNLDDVDGAPPGSQPLRAGGNALLAGWAAGADGTVVPTRVEVVLKGGHDYAVSAPTGAPRPDVAKATGHTSLARAGFQVNAGLAAVPAGRYEVVLRYSAAGKSWRCTTTHSVVLE